MNIVINNKLKNKFLLYTEKLKIIFKINNIVNKKIFNKKKLLSQEKIKNIKIKLLI